MVSINPTGKILGASVTDVDLSRPLDPATVDAIRNALGRYGILYFPEQDFGPAAQRDFVANFGAVQRSDEWNLPEAPEVTVLSNIEVNGQKTGYVDAGMSWHKDMTYLKRPGFTTVLYAVKVPRRNGRSLGETHFINTRAAYEDLPQDIKDKLDGAIGFNSAEYYNHYIRKAGGTRKAYDETKKAKRPPVQHPVVMVHPVTGDKVLYCDPGHVERIDGLPEGESEEMVRFLAQHQLQSKYEYVFEWTERDVLMWDNIGTLHRATLNYGPDEHRLMHRCMAA